MITTQTPVTELTDSTSRIAFLAAALQEQLFLSSKKADGTANNNDKENQNAMYGGGLKPAQVDAVVNSLKPKEQADYKREMRRILKNAADSNKTFPDGALAIPPLLQRRTTITSPLSLLSPVSPASVAVPFPFYSSNPLSQKARQSFAQYHKSHEIQLRFHDISTWDETHGKVLELLTDEGHRDAIGLEDYKDVIAEFEEWCKERGYGDILPKYQSIRTRRVMCQSSLPSWSQPGLTLGLFYACPAIPKADGELEDEEEKADIERKKRLALASAGGGGGGGGSADGANDAAASSTTTATTDANSSISDDTLAQAITTAVAHKVDARILFQKYVKSISLIKTEAELIMCDGDADGRITLQELESYISEIIPTVATLQGLPVDFIPYYTCSSARRIFWLLDPTNRGTVKISSLVNHSVLDDWLEVQMTAEEQTRNWFGTTISMQLRDKFFHLDIFGTSSLNLEAMKRYKKGIPMVIDDGLPADISPLSSLFLERFFDTTNPPKGELDYAAFVDFVVAIEFLPASCPRPLFFWRIFDIFDEGRITPLVVHSFFKETYAKLKSAEVEVAAIEIIIQEIFDLIPSKEPLVITKEEFVSAKQCGLFSALIFDCLAFYTYEHREQK